MRQFYEMNFITVTEEQHIEETLQDFDAWNFDAVAVNEMIGKIATQVIYCRMVAVYDLVQTISLDAEKLANFAKKIQSSSRRAAAPIGRAQLRALTLGGAV